MFICKNRTCFTCGEKKLIKHPKVSKFYEPGCLQNFILLFMFLLTVKLVKNSHI